MKTKRRPTVHMSRTLESTYPEYLESFPEHVQKYWRGGPELRQRVHDIIRDARGRGEEMPFEAAVDEGQAAYEADIAGGLASPPLTPQQAAQALRERSHAPVVYYMRMSELIKIGTTMDLRARYDNIHPQGVMAVEYGSFELERLRHNQFASLHSHGEWFHLQPELGAHIVAIRGTFVGENGEGVDEWLAKRLPATRREIRRH